MKKRRVQVSIVIDHMILENIDRIATQGGRNRAEIIREAIAEYIIIKSEPTILKKMDCAKQISPDQKNMEENLEVIS